MRTYILVAIAALGYFVDIFDLSLFKIVRLQSLKDLGLTGDELLATGVRLLNAQQFGMLLGGVLWGIIGDRIGRIQTLFGSILLYSLGNIANGFVTTVGQYELVRFITGIGIAGEIGGAVTLVGEVLSKERRGIGTSIVAAAGAFGAVVASYCSSLMSWRSLYLLGGALGLVLLVLRVASSESKLFESVKRDATVSKGNLLLLFSNRDRLTRFLALIAVGLPFIFGFNLMAAFSPEIATGVTGKTLSSAVPISYFAIGVTLGDLGCSLFSQLLQSRKRALGVFIIMQALSALGALHLHGGSETIFALWFLPLGFFGGLWAVLVTTASEQFGTNLRSTVTSSVPNFVRGCTVPLSILFLTCKESFSIISAVHIVGCLSLALALLGLYLIRESFGVSLSYIEVKDGQSSYGQESTTPAQQHAERNESKLRAASGF